jgi:rhamnogalacturonyl hydrolase YesR
VRAGACTLLVAIGVALAIGVNEGSGAEPGLGCAGQAAADYRALSTHLTRDARGSGTRYVDRFGGRASARAWSHGQAAAAAMDVGLVCGTWGDARRSLTGLKRFQRGVSYNSEQGRGPPDRYYDDNAWIGLDFIQALRMSGSARYLDRAQGVFSYLERGFSPHGGLYWKEDHPALRRSAATNGPALQLALHLFEQTGEQRYLDRALEIDEFIARHLHSPEGLIYDNVGDGGKVDRTVWSYNQGTYIGASVQLYELTGEAEYLDRAVATAAASLTHLADKDRLWRQPPAFNAIFFRNLLHLDAVAPDPAHRATLDAYLTRARATARQRSGLYGGGGLGSYGEGRGTALVDQAAFVQMHALLELSPAQLEYVS